MGLAKQNSLDVTNKVAIKMCTTFNLSMTTKNYSLRLNPMLWCSLNNSECIHRIKQYDIIVQVVIFYRVITVINSWIVFTCTAALPK